MKVSVALATYNGEKHIKRQIESIRLQTKRPDEIIICDDVSSDNTINILTKYIEDNKLEHIVKIHVNEKNLGHRDNFLQAINKCSGEIIFISDQDDYWYPNKIEEMTAAFKTQFDAEAICCTSIDKTEDGKVKESIITKVKKGRNDGKLKHMGFFTQTKINRCPGHCLALKKDFFYEIEKYIIDYDTSYDSIIGIIAAMKGTYYQYDKILVDRIIHENNVSSPNNTLLGKVSSSNYIKGRMIFIKLLESAQAFNQNEAILTSSNKKQLEKLINYKKWELKYLENNDLIKLFIHSFRLSIKDNKAVRIASLLYLLKNKN